MSKLVIGIGEYSVSNNNNEEIKTYALGSCVALMIFDKKQIAGMCHIALPDSKTNIQKSKELPGYFADTGIKIMIEKMIKLGMEKRTSWIKIAGGASITDPDSFFDIGKRNVLAIRKILWKYKLGIQTEDVGGNFSRTVTMKVSTGEIIISSGGNQWNI